MADKKTTVNLVYIASGRVKNCIVKKINIHLINTLRPILKQSLAN